MARAARDLTRILRLGLGLAFWIAPLLATALVGRPPSPGRTGAALRRLFASMGVSYVKLGQYLALRMDILPPETCRQLDRLFEYSDPLPEAVVHRVLEEELGAGVERLFERFDGRPVGAASIAQVHAAVTWQGEPVAVKVQRPGIEAAFRADLRNLLRLARLADRLRLVGRVSLTEAVETFGVFTLREMDFRQEAATARSLRRLAHSRDRVPRVHGELSGRRVLTLDFVEGTSFLTLVRAYREGGEAALRRHIRPERLRRTLDELAEECFRQYFELGLFHGDPHPANLLIRPDGSFVFIDFGIFGTLDAEQRARLAHYIRAIGTGRVRTAARAYVRLSHPTPWTDPAALEADLAAVLGTWFATLSNPASPLELRHMGRWQGEIFQVLRRHDVRLGTDFLLVWRAMLLLDTLGLQLPVGFDTQTATQRFFAEADRVDLEATENVLRTVATAARESLDLPSRGRRILAAAQRGLALGIRRRGVPADWRRRRAAAGRLLAPLAAVGGGALLPGIGETALPSTVAVGGIAAVAVASLASLLSRPRENDR